MSEDELGLDGSVLIAEDLEMLQMLATSSGARRIVEVQAVDRDETGESTLALCEALKKTGGTLVSIVRDSEQAEALRAQVREAGFNQPSQVLTGDPMKRLAALNGPVDLLFLAGQVDYAAALAAAMPRLRPGSLVVAYGARGKESYLRVVTQNPAFETTLLEQGSGLGISLLKS